MFQFKRLNNTAVIQIHECSVNIFTKFEGEYMQFFMFLSR